VIRERGLLRTPKRKKKKKRPVRSGSRGVFGRKKRNAKKGEKKKPDSGEKQK